MENVSVYGLEIYTEKQRYDEKFNCLMIDFINEAHQLVELSNDLYQIEHTIKLNKISLKDYILNSELCNMLKENNIKNYSISILEEYMNKCGEQNIMDITSYKLALELFKKLEKLEIIEKDKIDYEVNKLLPLISDIKKVETTDNKYFKELYDRYVDELRRIYLDNNQIDDKVYNYIIQILNDIFNYYLYGNKEILLNI